MTSEQARDHYRAKRRARNLRRYAKAACNPRATRTHRYPCGECYWCFKAGVE